MYFYYSFFEDLKNIYFDTLNKTMYSITPHLFVGHPSMLAIEPTTINYFLTHSPISSKKKDMLLLSIIERPLTF
jgi:hypothetical protein